MGRMSAAEEETMDAQHIVAYGLGVAFIGAMLVPLISSWLKKKD